MSNNDFFDNSINEASFDEVLSKDEIDTSSVDSEYVKKSAEMYYKLEIPKSHINTKSHAIIYNFFKMLYDTYADLFSVYYQENIKLNNNQNFYFLNIYFTLNKAINVRKFYLYNRSFLSLFAKLYQKQLWNVWLCLNYNNHPSEIGYTINNVFFATSTEKDRTYINMCLFYANDRFEDYVKYFSTKSIIECIYKNFQCFDNLIYFLNSNKTLYAFIPLIYQAEPHNSDISNLSFSLDLINKGFLIDDTFDKKLKSYEFFEITTIIKWYSLYGNFGKYNYDFNDCKEAAKSPVVKSTDFSFTYDEKNKKTTKTLNGSVFWHEKPIYVSLNTQQKFFMKDKVPALVIEVKQKV